MKKKMKNNTIEHEEVEILLDKLWDNWESRRKCEQTHTPEYIKRKNKKSHTK